MAVHHQLICKPPATVWSVLSDRDRYSDWVVGTDDSRPAYGDWPEVGAALEYTVRVGPWTMHGRTIVRHCEPPRTLELEAESGRLGTARIAIDIRPWGEDTLVVLDEHPLRGPGGTFHNAALDAVLLVRHRRMLSRLADVVENSGERDAGRSGDRSRT
jgi:uncharacterized protein YndB with AHSA1/START domain